MKLELAKSIQANVMMYNIKLNDKTVYDLNRNYVKPDKKRDIVKFYLEFGKEETIKKYRLSTPSFYKIIGGIGYLPTYNSAGSKYEFMQTEEEMFGFKCSYDDLSESEKKIYNKL